MKADPPKPSTLKSEAEGVYFDWKAYYAVHFPVGYNGGSTIVDAGYFYCPYIPGQPYIQPEWDYRSAVKTPTEIQKQIMDAVQNPVIR